MNPRILSVSLALALVAGSGCGGSRARRPAAEAKKGTATAAGATAQSAATGARAVREIALGEMCPAAVQGRPAVRPVALRRVVWSDSPDDAERALVRGEARQFAVLGWDGRRVGLFSVVGAADAGLSHDVGVGAYAGSSPCSRPASDSAERSDDPECVRVLDHCGVAVAALEPAGGFAARPFDEQPDPVSTRIGGACVADGKLLVDLDGDDKPEAFDASAFVAALREPADEVTTVDRGGASCTPRFAAAGIVPAGDPRDWRGLDLLGVLDLDDDGRFELVLAFNYADRRTWAVYSARGTSARVELVGEAEPWPRP